ncbi:MAG: hypothetical protein KBA03_05585 [Anaerolineaceae bacterium]|nr:hypothetical protein [Anaerolineaceae bacterium]
MSRALKAFLIAAVVIFLLYGVYFAFGRPSIPLPAIRYPVPAGQAIHKVIQGTDNNELRLTLDTKGKLQILDADSEILEVDYTPETLANTIDLALRFTPGDTEAAYEQFVDRYPIYPKLTDYVSNLFFRFLPLRISLILTATP